MRVMRKIDNNSVQKMSIIRLDEAYQNKDFCSNEESVRGSVISENIGETAHAARVYRITFLQSRNMLAQS